MLDAVAEQLDRDDPDLAAMLTPGRAHRYRMTWLSWLAVYLLVLPWAAVVFLAEPVGAVAVLVAPALAGVLGRVRQRCRRARRTGGSRRHH